MVTPLPIRICVAGATGWLGRALLPAFTADPRFALVGAVARTSAGAIADDVVPGTAREVRISATVDDALEHETDVLLDVTNARAVEGHVRAAIAHGVHVVIGTSGLTDATYQEIDRLAVARGVGVLAVGNFAISAVLLQQFAAIAARHLPSWEVIDYASADKPDAPSGTVRELAARLAATATSHVAIPVAETVGEPAARGLGAGGTRIHSVRLPGYTIGAEVLFGAPGERLSIRYDGGSGPESYVPGALLAAAHARDRVGLTRGLDHLLRVPAP